jgi:hypothetical protein
VNPPSRVGNHLVAQPHVGERAAHHDFVIAAPRAIGIEIPRLYAMLDQIFSSRAVLLDRTSRRNVVGGNAVAQYRQHTRALDVLDRRGLSVMPSK